MGDQERGGKTRQLTLILFIFLREVGILRLAALGTVALVVVRVGLVINAGRVSR